MPDMFEKPKRGDFIAFIVCAVIVIALFKIVVEVLT